MRRVAQQSINSLGALPDVYASLLRLLPERTFSVSVPIAKMDVSSVNGDGGAALRD
jgi:hypothetical protein